MGAMRTTVRSSLFTTATLSFAAYFVVTSCRLVLCPIVVRLWVCVLHATASMCGTECGLLTAVVTGQRVGDSFRPFSTASWPLGCMLLRVAGNAPAG